MIFRTGNTEPLNLKLQEKKKNTHTMKYLKCW